MEDTQAEKGIRLSYPQKVALVSLVGLLILLFLFRIRGVLSPFIWAIIFAYVFDPLVDWACRRTRVPRWVMVTAIYLVFVVFLGWLGYRVVPRITREIMGLRRTYPELLRPFTESPLGEELLALLGLDAQAFVGLLVDALQAQWLGALRIATQTFEVLAKFLAFVPVSFLLLLDAHKIGKAVEGLIPAQHREELLALGGRMNSILGAYIRGQLILFTLMATLTYIAMGPILHLRFALVVSITTGILEWFPIVGPVTAGAIAVSIGLFQQNVFGWPSWVYGLVIAAIYTVLRHAEDYLVIPNVIGRVVKLHPVLVLFALFAGASIGGVLGMFIAVPIAAVLRVLAEYLHQKLVT